jgi:hypothetical protein
MWCKWRTASKEIYLYFGDGKHRVWTESVCANPCDAGEDLCVKCKKKIPKPECQYNGTFPHGIVDGPYSEKSHIYDSPWYHKNLEEYGAPSEETIALAMEAQRRARNGQPTKFLHDLGVAVLKAEERTDSEEMPVKKAVKTPAKKIIPERPIAEPLISPPTVAEQLSEAIVKKIMKEHKAAETMDDVLPVRFVSRVRLQRFAHEGVNYWLDAERDKLYHINQDGMKGDYVGQLDSALKIIQYKDDEQDA